MGIVLTCENCGKTHRYDKGEIKTQGSVLSPVWSVRCRECGSEIRGQLESAEGGDRGPEEGA